MAQEDTIKWISSTVVPRMLQKEEFQEYIIQKTEVKSIGINKDNWASSLFEIIVHFDQSSNKKQLSLFLKLMDDDERVRIRMASEKQFFNEIHFYSAVIPLFLSHVAGPLKAKTDFERMFPKCFYTYYDCSRIPLTTKDAIVVLENLQPKNFKLGNRTTLDLNHCKLTLARLGCFHAFSYFVKERDPEAFRTAVMQPFHETRFTAAQTKMVNSAVGVIERRVIDALAKELPDGDPRLARLRNIAKRGANDVFNELVRPREPLSVLCHGDFLRNNIMFQYENDRVVDLKIVDFQMMRYASPSIDVSMFICMNTSHEVRVAHFDELLQVYHTSLTETLTSLLGKTKNQLDRIYSFDVFLANFREYALYGYLMAIEFIPWMIVDDEDLAVVSQLLIEGKESPMYNEATRVLGGEEATIACVELAKDLFAKQCL